MPLISSEKLRELQEEKVKNILRFEEIEKEMSEERIRIVKSWNVTKQ